MDKKLLATEKTTISIYSPDGSGNFYWEKDKVSEFLKALAEALDFYVHGSPCDDTACPCRAAEHDHMVDMGYRGPEGA